MNQYSGVASPSAALAAVALSLGDVVTTLNGAGEGWEGKAGAACSEQVASLAERATCLADVLDGLAARARVLESA